MVKLKQRGIEQCREAPLAEPASRSERRCRRCSQEALDVFKEQCEARPIYQKAPKCADSFVRASLFLAKPPVSARRTQEEGASSIAGRGSRSVCAKSKERKGPKILGQKSHAHMRSEEATAEKHPPSTPTSHRISIGRNCVPSTLHTENHLHGRSNKAASLCRPTERALSLLRSAAKQQ